MTFRTILTREVADAIYPGPGKIIANVKSFGAKGDGSTEDAVAIQAAFDEVHADALSGSRQAAIYFPPGYYRCGTRILVPGDNGVGVSVCGAGVGVSLVQFSEAGAGTAGFQQAVRNIGGGTKPVFDNLTVRGPGTNTGLGQSSTQMDGVELVLGGRADRLSVSGFRAAITVWADHWQLRDVRGQGSLYGLYVRQPGGQRGSGNQLIDGCDFSSNLLASIALDPKSSLLAATIRDTHVGFGPFAFYAESSVGVDGGENEMIAESLISVMGTESVGNGLIYDAGRNRALRSNTWDLTGFAGIPDPALRSTLHPHDYGMVAGSVVGNRFRGGGTAWAHGFYDLGGVDTTEFSGNTLEGLGLGAMASLGTVGKHWLKSGTGLGVADSNRFGDSASAGFIGVASATITAGALVQQDANGTVKPWAPGSGGIVRGVAGFAAAAGDVVAIIDTGLARVRYDTQRFSNTPARVQPSTTTAGTITDSGATAANAIGWARSNADASDPVGYVELRGLR